MKEPQIRETMKMPCTTYNNKKIASKKKEKMGGKKRMPETRPSVALGYSPELSTLCARQAEGL